jgi:serralysin
MSASLNDEVAFISNVNADGTLALYSFGAWNPGTIPADYSGGYTNAMKWDGITVGTPGGTVYYYFNPASN